MWMCYGHVRAHALYTHLPVQFVTSTNGLVGGSRSHRVTQRSHFDDCWGHSPASTAGDSTKGLVRASVLVLLAASHSLVWAAVVCLTAAALILSNERAVAVHLRGGEPVGIGLDRIGWVGRKGGGAV